MHNRPRYASHKQTSVQCYVSIIFALHFSNEIRPTALSGANGGMNNEQRMLQHEENAGQYHLLHGNACNVLRKGRSVNGKRPTLTPDRSETPRPSKTKFNTTYNVQGNSS
jgi:hypothetical protein